MLPPVVAFLGAEDARIDLEQSPSSFKRLFASFQRRIQSRTSSTEDMGTYSVCVLPFTLRVRCQWAAEPAVTRESDPSMTCPSPSSLFSLLATRL